MKRQALEQVVNRHLHHIEKYGSQIPGSFAAEDIHELRVEYKKSRAFLRLLQTEPKAGDLSMPHSLRTVYKAAGKVRDIQLFLSRINGPLTCFINCWQKRLFNCKEALVKAIEDLHIKKATGAIKKELPHHLQDETIQKFIQEKVAAIHIILLAAEEEKDLHAIRKHLKDIIYNIRLFEHDLQIPFPAPGFASEKTLNEMATKLGDFNDGCIAVSMLHQHGCDDLPAEEKKVLDQLLANWEQQKKKQQQQLLQQVQQLTMLHAS